MSSQNSCNLPSADIWRQWAADLSLELGVPVTWSVLGFLVHGVHVSDPQAVRAIAGPK